MVSEMGLFSKKITLFKKKDRETWQMIKSLLKDAGLKGTKARHYPIDSLSACGYGSKLDPRNFSVDGNNAVIIGQSRVNAAVFGGGRHTWRLELDIDLIDKDGQWLMTEARAST